jgi:hypothetical protein
LEHIGTTHRKIFRPSAYIQYNESYEMSEGIFIPFFAYFMFVLHWLFPLLMRLKLMSVFVLFQAGPICFPALTGCGDGADGADKPIPGIPGKHPSNLL